MSEIRVYLKLNRHGGCRVELRNRHNTILPYAKTNQIPDNYQELTVIFESSSTNHTYQLPTIPKGVSCIYFYGCGLECIECGPNTIPNTVNKVSINKVAFKNDIIYTLPHITNFEIDDIGSRNMNTYHHITRLRLSSVDKMVIYPPYLTHLELPYITLDKLQIPPTITHLHIPGVKLCTGDLPDTLVYLRLYTYPYQLYQNVIPGSVKHLQIGNGFNYPLDNVLHEGLETLSLREYDQPINRSTFPTTLTKLDLESFNKQITLGSLPDSLIELRMPSYQYQVSREILPLSLQVLTVNTCTLSNISALNVPVIYTTGNDAIPTTITGCDNYITTSHGKNHKLIYVGNVRILGQLLSYSKETTERDIDSPNPSVDEKVVVTDDGSDKPSSSIPTQCHNDCTTEPYTKNMVTYAEYDKHLNSAINDQIDTIVNHARYEIEKSTTTMLDKLSTDIETRLRTNIIRKIGCTTKYHEKYGEIAHNTRINTHGINIGRHSDSCIYQSSQNTYDEKLSAAKEVLYRSLENDEYIIAINYHGATVCNRCRETGSYLVTVYIWSNLGNLYKSSLDRDDMNRNILSFKGIHKNIQLSKFHIDMIKSLPNNLVETASSGDNYIEQLYHAITNSCISNWHRIDSGNYLVDFKSKTVNYHNPEQDIQIRECQQKLEEYRAVLEKYRNKLDKMKIAKEKLRQSNDYLAEIVDNIRDLTH